MFAYALWAWVFASMLWACAIWEICEPREHEWFGKFVNDYEEVQMILLCVIMSVERAWMIASKCECWTSISDYEWLWMSMNMNDREQLWTSNKHEWLWNYWTIFMIGLWMWVRSNMWMKMKSDLWMKTRNNLWMKAKSDLWVSVKNDWNWKTICGWWVICEWKTFWKKLCIFCEINFMHSMSGNVFSVVSPNQLKI
jgi:hypothetical protein